MLRTRPPRTEVALLCPVRAVRRPIVRLRDLDPADRQRLGERLQDDARRRFAPDAYVSRLTELYDHLVAAGASR